MGATHIVLAQAKRAEARCSEIMKKLKLGSLAGLIRYAIRNEIIQP